MQISFISHNGKKEYNQEDSLLVTGQVLNIATTKTILCQTNTPSMLAVADGIAGLPYGEIASQKTLEFLNNDWSNNQSASIVSSIKKTQQKLSLHAIKNPKYRDMGATLAGLIINDGFIEIFNVGDSRVYEITNNSITQLSYDHTVLNAMIKRGEINESQTNKISEMYKMLDSCITACEDGDDFAIHYTQKTIPDDIIGYLITTDGVHDLIDNDKLLEITTQNSNESLNSLYKLIKKLKPIDNFTAILVKEIM